MSATIRKSVPVTAEDQRDVELLREEEAYRAAYAAAMGRALPDKPSEAEVLHALLELGRSALSEQVRVTGYAALAASTSEEDAQIRRAVRERRNLRVRD